MPRAIATSSTARSTPDCPPERSFMGFHASFLGPGPALLSATICAYIPWCWRKPAMAINGRRNKPFGPGGGTRRLHQFSEDEVVLRLRGRNRIDEGVKGALLPGMVPV